MNPLGSLQESSRVKSHFLLAPLAGPASLEKPITPCLKAQMAEIQRARAALFHLDAGCSRDEWVRVGMAAKSAGLSFDDFHGWSALGSNYASENECWTVWKSFDESGPVTPATLYAMAFAQGWEDVNKSRLTRKRQYKHKAAPKKTNHRTTTQTSNPKAVEIWSNCIPATPAAPYIYRKQGKSDGLRVYPASAAPLIIHGQNMAGYLVVPCWSGDKLQTLQFISPEKENGRKLNLPESSFNDGFFTVGEITDRVYICEGVGQAWACNKATGGGAVVCFGAGRMATVAKALHDRYPDTLLVLVPDRGKESQAADVASMVAGRWVELPAGKPANYDVNDYFQESGTDALTALLEHPHAPEMRYKLLSGTDLYNAPPMRWLVRGVLPFEGLAALYGASGSGKSFLALDLACAVADGGSEWFGRGVMQSPVTYICLEGEAGIGKRAKAWSLRHKRPLPDALRFIAQPFDLLSNDLPELAKTVIAGGGAGGMLIIDTLNRATPGIDENSSGDMGNLIVAAKQLQSLIGGLVLLVHHSGKDATKGLRGHSSLFAALDCVLEVVKTDMRRVWSVAKSKDDVTGDVYPFKLEILSVGIDEDGEEITSCVVQPDDTGVPMPGKRLKLGANQAIARKVLDEPFCNSECSGKDGAPAGRPCINYDEAVTIVSEHIPTDSKHKKIRAQTAITGLVAKGVMGMKGDWIWLI